ncbi:RpiB/LacA/LacB family sugar-phosphate isomerase [Candidatus Dependentiae bacterium]|nr:RpiB/LacA/LacB family sugar-phosphate isomerase [Candidatus Dependentiae bacterium]
MQIRIAIGADHRGFELKQYLLTVTSIAGITIEWLDCGTDSTERTDYPIYTDLVVEKVLAEQTRVGILLCGSGIGMSIAANRYPGIFAALVWNDLVAQIAKQDDNANIIVLPANFIDSDQAIAIVKAWLTATFKQGRYQQRLSMLD